jgi:spore germination protein (amino acid permease)
MIKEGKIGPREAISLVTITISSKVLLSSPGDLIALVGTAGWYTTLISASAAAIGFQFIYLLMKRFPDKSLVEVSEMVLGRVLGAVCMIILASFLFFTGVLNSRELVETSIIYDYPQTPPSVILLFIILVLGVIAYLGLEALARTAGMWSMALLVGFLSIFVLAIPFYNTAYLFPILGYGLGKSIAHGVIRSSAYGEVVILAVIANSLQGSKYIKRAGFISLAISGGLISLALFCYTFFAGYNYLVENAVPLLKLTQQIQFGRFFQRFESIYLFSWVISVTISAAATFYACVSVYCKVFKITDQKPLIIPFLVLFFVAGMSMPDFAHVLMLVKFARRYGLIVYFILPFLVWLVAVLRKMEGKTRHA